MNAQPLHLSSRQPSRVAEPAPLTPLVRLLIAVIATELFAFCALVGIYVVFRASHPQESNRALLQFADWRWGAGQLAVLLLAALAAWLVLPRMRNGNGAATMMLSAVVVMYGLAGLGLKGMEWARWGGPHVIVVPASADMTVASTTSKSNPATTQGDDKAGAKAYTATCAGCHGVAAAGLPGVAPSLSDLTKQSSDGVLTAVISGGRPANDPASKTGKVMPPRGGNPFLTDGDVRNIVAFLRKLGSSSAGVEVNTSAGAPIGVPRWVVPLPPAGPEGLADEFKPKPPVMRLPPALKVQEPTTADRAFAPVAAALTGLHAMHLLVGIALAAGLLWQGFLATAVMDLRLAHFTRVYWAAAAVMWILLFPLLYVL